jgi:hypothetical protein
MTPRKIASALTADKAAPATRKQFMDLALRKRDRVTVVSEGAPVMECPFSEHVGIRGNKTAAGSVSSLGH